MDDGIYTILIITFQCYPPIVPEECDFASGYFILTTDDFGTRAAQNELTLCYNINGLVANSNLIIKFDANLPLRHQSFDIATGCG